MTLEHMIALGDLNGHLRALLLSCKVDELSPGTLKDYEQKIGAFLRHRYVHNLGSSRSETYVKIWQIQ